MRDGHNHSVPRWCRLLVSVVPVTLVLCLVIPQGVSAEKTMGEEASADEVSKDEELNVEELVKRALRNV